MIDFRNKYLYCKNEHNDGLPGLGCFMWAKSRVDSHASLIFSGRIDPKKLKTKYLN